MFKHCRFYSLSAALVLYGLVAPANSACLDAAQTRQAIAQGQAAPLARVLHRNGINAKDVVRVQLCENGPRWDYIVTLVTGGSKRLPAG